MRRDALGDVKIDHARLDHDARVGEIDIEDAVEPTQADHDPARDWQRAAAQAGARAARHERNPLAVADAYDALDFGGRGGQHDGGGQYPKVGQAVALVGMELARLGDQALAADDRAQFVDDLLLHRRSLADGIERPVQRCASIGRRGRRCQTREH